jgi:hypothetical protein
MNNTHKAVLIPTDVKRADTIMFPRKSQKPRKARLRATATKKNKQWRKT